jgi:hypothetical protein
MTRRCEEGEGRNERKEERKKVLMGEVGERG